jgi:hypothetical protein
MEDIGPNPFETEDEKKIAEQLNNLANTANEGALIADLMRHPGFKPFKAWLDAKAIDTHAAWLKADDNEAAKIRHQGQVFQEVADYFNARVARGNAATQAIEQHEKEQKQLAEGFSAFQADGALGPIQRERP